MRVSPQLYPRSVCSLVLTWEWITGRLVNALFVCLHTLRWSSRSLSYFRLGFEEQGLGVGLKFVCFTFSKRELPLLSSFLLIFSLLPYECSHTHIHTHLRSEVVWSAEAAYVNAERLSSVWVCIHQGNQASADGESSLQEQIRSPGSHTAVTELLPIMGLRGAGGWAREHVCGCTCVYSHTNMPICKLPSILYGMCACMYVNVTPLW